VTQPTHHRWRQQYGGIQAEVATRLTQLEKQRPSQEDSGGGRAGEGDAEGTCRGKLLSPERRRRAVKVLLERYRPLKV